MSPTPRDSPPPTPCAWPAISTASRSPPNRCRASATRISCCATHAGPRFVLKIANRDEALEVLDLQNKLLAIPGRRADTGLAVSAPGGGPFGPGRSRRWPARMAAAYFVRLLTWVDGVLHGRPCNLTPRRCCARWARLWRGWTTRSADFSHRAAHRVFYWDLRHAVDGMARISTCSPSLAAACSSRLWTPGRRSIGAALPTGVDL